MAQRVKPPLAGCTVVSDFTIRSSSICPTLECQGTHATYRTVPDAPWPEVQSVPTPSACTASWWLLMIGSTQGEPSRRRRNRRRRATFVYVVWRHGRKTARCTICEKKLWAAKSAPRAGRSKPMCGPPVLQPGEETTVAAVKSVGAC
jgi:hypothetical protein